MGTRTLNPTLATYNVDEVIETLPIPTARKHEVEKALMHLAPKAYQAPGVPIKDIWWLLPNHLQDLLNQLTVDLINRAAGPPPWL